jgi:pimeloyl-ACP methyl ester carboxylesterase
VIRLETSSSSSVLRVPTSSSVRHVNGVDLHVLEAGPEEGPLVVLLHGFPDFNWGWRHQIEHLAEQGFRVVAPDQRGYNLSSKPRGIAAYHLDTLAADVIALVDCYNRPSFCLAGHDWGGVIAWWVAARYPNRVERVAILNAPHPDVFVRFLRRHPGQMVRSLYVAFFQLPFLPEALMKRNNCAMLRRALTRSSLPGAFSEDELKSYVEAWKQPGALTAMVNYYRALARRPWRRPARIHPRTLVLWGKQDVFLKSASATASLKLCDRGQIVFLERAGHWVQREEATTINEALTDFFSHPREEV